MASLSGFRAIQAAVLRNSMPMTAGPEQLVGTPYEEYAAQLIELAEISTEPVLLMFDVVLGRIPTSQKLDTLAAFAELQFNYYRDVLRVEDPALGPYEALGRGLSGTEEFRRQSDGKTDGQFIVDAWAKAHKTESNSFALGLNVIEHYEDQISYFVHIYSAAGIQDSEALVQARGAVFGQIVGYAAGVEDGVLDAPAETWLDWAWRGIERYSLPLVQATGIALESPDWHG